MKTALVLVAHPDDCIIFCQHFIYAYRREYKFEICYLTHASDSARIAEVSRYWSSRGVTIRTLGLEDAEKDLVENRVNAGWFGIHRQLRDIFRNFDLILTHGANGEYGHPHHVFCHFVARAAVDTNKQIFVTVALHDDEANLIINGEFGLDRTELPLHGKAIQGFANKYGCLKHGRYKDYSGTFASPVMLDMPLHWR